MMTNESLQHITIQFIDRFFFLFFFFFSIPTPPTTYALIIEQKQIYMVQWLLSKLKSIRASAACSKIAPQNKMSERIQDGKSNP